MGEIVDKWQEAENEGENHVENDKTKIFSRLGSFVPGIEYVKERKAKDTEYSTRSTTSKCQRLFREKMNKRNNLHAGLSLSTDSASQNETKNSGKEIDDSKANGTDRPFHIASQEYLDNHVE